MKYLILTVSAGNGHNSAANTIKEKILKEDASAIVDLVDVYKRYAPKFVSWKVQQGYALACQHLLSLYNAGFKVCEKNTYETRFTNYSHHEVMHFINGLMQKIMQFKPDVIVSTHIFVSVALSDLKMLYTIPAKLATLTLDYGISPYWESTNNVDVMFLTSEYMVEKFKHLGFSSEQLIVSGIVTNEQFNVEINKAQARKELGLDENMFTMLVMKNGFFSVKNYRLLKEFAKIKQPIQIVLINGKSKKSKRDLDIKLKKSKQKNKIFNLGFVDEIEKYFSASDVILSKGGGLSTTEAINKGVPMIIVDNLPQQEIYNKNYLVEHNCALGVSKSSKINELVNWLLDNPAELEKLRQNNLKLRNKNSAQIIYDKLKSFGMADYSKTIIPQDSKAEMLKKLKLVLKSESKKVKRSRAKRKIKATKKS